MLIVKVSVVTSPLVMVVGLKLLPRFANGATVIQLEITLLAALPAMTVILSLLFVKAAGLPVQVRFSKPALLVTPTLIWQS